MASAAVGVLPFGGNLDVWAAMASAADGPLCGVGPFGICVPSISASVITRFRDSVPFDVWAAMASAAVGPLRGVGPFGVCVPSISSSEHNSFL